jgi:hypothetical protein
MASADAGAIFLIPNSINLSWRKSFRKQIIPVNTTTRLEPAVILSDLYETTVEMETAG